MNPTEALSLIREIANSPGRIDKQAGLEKLLADDLGKFIVSWAYDPFVTYGVKIKKMPPAHSDGTIATITDGVVLRVLTQLSTRELSGNAAKDEINFLFNALDLDSRELLFMILAQDLKAGISNATIEAALPGFLPSFGVMRAQPYEDKHVTKFPIAVEPKLDGYRCTFIAKEGKGAFFTRSGKAIPAFQELAEPMLEAARHMKAGLDGDVDDHYRDVVTILFDGNNEHPTFVLDGEAMNGLFANMGAIKRKNGELFEAELHGFDMMPLSGFLGSTPYKVPYEVRRMVLSTFVSELRAVTGAPVFETPIYEANSHDEIEEIYQRLINQTIANYLARGDAKREKELELVTIDKATGKLKCLEGGMVKPYDSEYEKKKSRAWLKMKPEDTIDLFINGFYNGEENAENEDRLGGAIVDHKGVDVRVGGGWSHDERDALWEDWKHDAAILGIDPKVGFKPGYRLDPADIHGRGFKFIGRMIEIEFNEVTPDGSLRHPRYDRFRDDKAGEALRELQAAA